MKHPDLGRLGIPGVAGAGLALFCLSFYLGTIADDRAELAALQEEEIRLAATVQSNIAPGRTAAPTALPLLSSAPDLITRLKEAGTKLGLDIDPMSYALTTEAGWQRYDVSLPVKASYPVLRRYLQEALALSSAAAINSLHLTRGNSADPTVETTVQISYYFAAP